MARITGLQKLLDDLAELPAFERNQFYLVNGHAIERLKEFDRTGVDPDAYKGPPLTGAYAELASQPITEADAREMAEARRLAEGRRYEVGDWRNDAKVQAELEGDILARISSRYTGTNYSRVVAAGAQVLAESGDQFKFDTDLSRDTFADAVAQKAGAKLRHSEQEESEPERLLDPITGNDEANREWLSELSDAKAEAGYR